MRNIHIVMPMAGEGSRFVKQGWTTPKPLIEVDGVRLFERAINSLKLEEIVPRYSFIIRKEHVLKYNLDLVLKQKIPQANVYIIEQTTRGAAETCLIAAKNIPSQDALLLLDCDLEFKSKAFDQAIQNTLFAKESILDGALVSFKADSPRYSYAKTNANGFVIETAEKKVISDKALCGAYFFSRNEDFLNATNVLMTSPVYQDKELYISLLFNELLKLGKKIKLFHVDQYNSFGTPEEIKAFYDKSR